MEKALGRHLLLECYDCAIEPLNQVVFMEQMMRQAASLLEVNMIDSHFHHFAPYGVSGVIIIEESHLTLHTWPEYQYAAIDFFTCGPTADPQIAINYLQEVLNAERVRESWIPRGALSILPNPPLSLERNTQITRHRGERQVWFTDRDENVAISLRHKGDLLFQKQSDLQLVEVYDTFEFGKMLSLDSVIMCTEKDEPGYHEMLVHVPVQSFPNPLRRVLIIGGGDGGTARELIRYGQVEQIILVEIDPVVIEAVKNHIPSLSESFLDDRVQMEIADGFDFVKSALADSFDLILVDAPDPEGPAAILFSEVFYQEAWRILRSGGVLVTQSESPYYRSDTFLACRARLRNLFGAESVRSYLTFIPTYTSGMWSFTIASKDIQIDFGQPDPSRTAPHGLRYYNPAIHRAAFALPNFVKRMIIE